MLSLLAESWTWYSFAGLIVITRLISRWLQLGSIKRYQIEDYVMVVVFCFYTVLVSCMNIVAHLDTNLMLPTDIPTLTPDSIKSRIRGSKLVLVVEQSMIMTIWGCKICLLLMYNKLTFGLKQQLAVKIVGVYVICNLIIMEILYFGVWCRPFHEYWAVPVDNVQCSTALHHLIVNATFNISSDLMMLCIPLPLLITSQLPRTKKLILCCLFGLGVFVILCAVLNKYYSFAHPFSPMWTFWYIREASTAILVANFPMCWALMRRLFNLRSFNAASNTQSKGNTAASNFHSNRKGGPYGPSIEMSSNNKGEGRGETSWWDRERALSKTESEEYIVPPGKARLPLEIWESKEFDVVNDRGSSVIGIQEQARIYNALEDNGRGEQFKTQTTVTAQRSSESSGDV